MVQRDLLLAEYTGGHVHIAHLSTGSLGGVRAGGQEAAACGRPARSRRITWCSPIMPPSGVYDTNAKMNPPLREERDREALLEAIADGTIDCIATDHAPHHSDEKCVEFSNAPFGIVGLETAVSLCIDRLVHAGVIDLGRMVQLLSPAPARILHLDRGHLRVGADADVTVLDLEREVEVKADESHSRSSNTPFEGWTLRGAAVMTLVGGEIRHDVRDLTAAGDAG